MDNITISDLSVKQTLEDSDKFVIRDENNVDQAIAGSALSTKFQAKGDYVTPTSLETTLEDYETSAHAENTYETKTHANETYAKNDKILVDNQLIQSRSYPPGMTSIDISSIMAEKQKEGYMRFPIAYSVTQNYLIVSFSPIQNGSYYMNVYNGYSSSLTSAIEIQFIYIKNT